MKLLDCPINGTRPLSEFVWGGEVREAPDPTAVSDAEWAAYVFHRDSRPGVKSEWWRHEPSGTWFIADRDVQKDLFLRTYLFGETPGEPSSPLSRSEPTTPAEPSPRRPGPEPGLPVEPSPAGSGGRLPAVPGEWIDRSRPLQFRFEGDEYSGFQGDTVSSALWAAGRRVLGRSFKYHRPRGILSLANHDCNVLLTDGKSINLRGDVVPLTAGVDLRSVQPEGSLDADRASLLDRLSGFLPVGFYYKAFHRPGWSFPHWERLFRKLSGLGRIDPASREPARSKRFEFCDVLVVGAGPSGLSAALAAAEGGAEVLVVDEWPHPGGSLLLSRAASSPALLAELPAQVAREPRIRILCGAFAAGYYADHWVPVVTREGLLKVRAKAVIVSTGAIEQPAVFRNNDLPGVMLGSAAARLAHCYAVRPAKRALILTANEEGYALALDLVGAGCEVAAVVDWRTEGETGPLSAMVEKSGVRVVRGACVYSADAADPRLGLSSAILAPVDGHGHPLGTGRETIACDGLLMSTGFAPAAALLYQSGARMRYSRELEQFVPESLPPGVFAAGRVNGVYGLRERQTDGERAGCEALRHLGMQPRRSFSAPPPPTRRPSHPFPIVEHPMGKNFVDFDEDLQLKDFGNASAEGFDNIELLKRYSTVGMGPSQGKHSNMNAVRILSRLRGLPIDSIGTTTSRPFYHPVTLEDLAGQSFRPERRTSLHSRHMEQGARMFSAGAWLRPEFYERSGIDRRTAIFEEAAAVREGVGAIDVGTLGKIEVYGPDAGEFLERTYAGRFAKMRPGTLRYGLLLDESGVIVDDGVVARLAEDHFYFTTTSSGSAAVYRELQRWLLRWGLDCALVQVTGAWGAINLAGPSARRVLSALTSADLSAEAFPYLAVRLAEVAGVPARLMRVGFVGELGYEIHAPAADTPRLWDALFREGQAAGIQAFGVEAQRLLRLEKGHVILGQDTDGLTTPVEASLEWAVRMDKPFFIGQRSLQAMAGRPPRHRLVGFVLDAADAEHAPSECHLVLHQGEIGGRVTSIARSRTLNRIIGLAYVPPALSTPGSRLEIRSEGGRMVRAEVVKTPFYDPEGRRQKVGEHAAEDSA